MTTSPDTNTGTSPDTATTTTPTSGRRRFIDPADLVCPGCGEQVRCAPPAFWLVHDGLPAAQFSHADATALCRTRGGQISPGRGDPMTTPTVTAPIVGAVVTPEAGRGEGPISAPMVAALECAASSLASRPGPFGWPSACLDTACGQLVLAAFGERASLGQEPTAAITGKAMRFLGTRRPQGRGRPEQRRGRVGRWRYRLQRLG